MTKTAEVYEKVTATLIAEMERGRIPWSRPWLAPVSIHGHVYRGINALILGCKSYGSPVWLTYNQAKAMGGHVRKGERGTTVMLWKTSKYNRTDASGETEERRGLYCTTYTVFNIEQCEGVPLPAKFERNDHAADETAQAMLEAYLASGPRMTHNGGRAYYRPSTDTMNVPPLADFRSVGEYYSTAFHEAVHSTGHASRLAREGITDAIVFGSHTYAQEELVAEMGAAFLCALAGLDCGAVVQNQAAYLKNWLSVFRGDPKRLVQAASAAQKAADLVMGASAAEESEAA